MSYSVCFLGYGEFSNLVRSLEAIPLAYKDNFADFRIGVNAGSVRLKEAAHLQAYRLAKHTRKPVTLFFADANPGKYPLMRRMFRDQQLLSERIMWFDDDSFFAPACKDSWWQELFLLEKTNLVVGRIHNARQRGLQYVRIAKQPWYTGKTLNATHQYRFVTGAWWTADSDFILKWDYPFLELYHNGGDSILGELVRQQNGSLGEHSAVQCGCDFCIRNKPVIDPGLFLNVGGRKARRGIGVKTETYPWQGKPKPASQFELQVFRY